MWGTRIEIGHTRCCRKDFGGQRWGRRWWWPYRIVRSARCTRRKTPKRHCVPSPLQSQWDLVHIDLVGMEVTVKTKKKPVVQKILVVTNHFSWFVQAYKVKDKRAITIAKCLYNNYFRHYSFPQHLISDQGTEFCNAILNKMCIYLNIKKTLHIAVSSTDEWCSRTFPSDTRANDRQTGQQMT